MNIPKGATHRWSRSGLYAKRCGGNTWAIWQDEEWLWIGDEFKGQMVPLVDEREKAIRQMGVIVLSQEKFSVMDGVAALYDAGYRKFEIVEEDV